MSSPCPAPLAPPPSWTPQQPAPFTWQCHAPAIPAASLGLILAHVAAYGLWLALAYVLVRANFGQRITDWWRPILISSISPERTRP